MLVLTRKQSETIQIGDSITITVLRMKGKSVRIGIKAPHDMNVIRGELAFEQPEERPVEGEVGEAEIAEGSTKSRSRSSGPRQDKSWLAKAEPQASVRGASSVAWSI